MNKWIKRFLILSQLGGGFMSLALIIQNLFGIRTFDISLLIYVVFIAFAIFSIFAGFQLIEGKPKALLVSAICQAIQIPLFYTKLASYLCSTGLLGAIYFQRNPEQSKFGFEFILGCRTEIHLLKEMNFTIGINVVALALFIYLLKQIKQKSNQQVDPIVTTPADKVEAQSTQGHP